MGSLDEAFRDAAGEVAQIKSRPSNRYWWLYGTIKAKNSNGTLDVAVDGVTIQQMKATVSCMMANAGDRAIVLKAGPLMTCVDVIATSDKASIPASSITGTLPASSLPTASPAEKGIMRVGSGLTALDGLVSVDDDAYVSCTAERKLFTGSVVRTVGAGADSVRVWSSSEFSSEFGRAFSATKDYIGFANGDAVANDVHIQGSSYMSTDAGIYAVFNKSRPADASIRINYLVVLA